MIARHETMVDKTDIWAKLAAPLPQGVISWRQDGKPIQRDGKWFARFVCYIEANTVRERLDSVVPGEWDLTLDLLPPLPGSDDEGMGASFKARLQILGVIREDVGNGRDYKAAATDAFKRAAVRFGVAHELYAYEQNWVQVDGDGRYSKPLEDPAAAYARRYGAKETAAAGGGEEAPRAATARTARARTAAARENAATREQETVTSEPAAAALAAADAEVPNCPKCGGRMWDNRLSKRNPKAPDFKCRDRSCDGVVWPAKGRPQGAGAEPVPAGTNDPGPLVDHDVDAEESPVMDELPF